MEKRLFSFLCLLKQSSQVQQVSTALLVLNISLNCKIIKIQSILCDANSATFLMMFICTAFHNAAYQSFKVVCCACVCILHARMCVC